MRVKESKSSNSLTKYPIGSFKEFLALAIPLMLTSFSVSFLEFCDRYFLSLYSTEAWKACSAAMGLCFFFQVSFMMIAFISQGFIGHYKGSRQEKMIGPFTWQMIYFSICSIVITYPLSFLSLWYLKGIDGAILYFRYLAGANFLFPLGATLASFYLGRGRNKIIFLVTFVTHMINIVLDYLLILGVPGIIEPMGIHGAAIATITAQSVYCLILFLSFQKKKYIHRYGTHLKAFNMPLLWEGLKAGFPRTFGRSMVIGSWIVGSYFVIHHAEEGLLIHTFGVTLFLVFSFMAEGLGRALLTIASHALGAKLDHQIFFKILRTAFGVLIIIMTLLALPLIFAQDLLIRLFVNSAISPNALQVLEKCYFFIWISCLASGINRIGTSLITASRDTLFYAYSISFMWITLCIPTYLGIIKLGWPPYFFFLIDAANTSLFGILFILRFLRNPLRKIGTSLIRINYIQV
ncbi:MATE family efflux transporter [Candidatus Neptunochlamydia vexilliferae]|uniref:MATE family efflux transporter n=1 Tax=Candidatus Neptunichlamydia vexilliferae TaxID=1651774 RepID=A0ABS0AZU9_9BACT|nr:MATE family efflux transporter [Candidatus Neptunochlamydia vexilliferae]MBF5059663.1 hypothetical protein [Candidatus Neptunochlamydia vexilliferae]